MICPGQDTRYWKPGDIFEAPCPHCGHAVEFFKDESKRRCRGCHRLVTNPRMDFGCAAYCKYAEQCLGELSPDLLSKRKDLLKDRVAVEMKKYFKQDFKSISHAMKVARYAEQIAGIDSHNTGDLAVILSAAYLHGIACPEPGSTGPASGAVCEGIGSVSLLLEGMGASRDLIEEVLDSITALRDGSQRKASTNAKILKDAHTTAHWQEKREEGLTSDEDVLRALEDVFETENGRAIARQVLTG